MQVKKRQASSLATDILMQMNITLRERNLNVIGLKRLLNCLVDTVFGVIEAGSLNPAANSDIDTAVTKLVNPYLQMLLLTEAG